MQEVRPSDMSSCPPVASETVAVTGAKEQFSSIPLAGDHDSPASAPDLSHVCFVGVDSPAGRNLGERTVFREHGQGRRESTSFQAGAKHTFTLEGLPSERDQQGLSWVWLFDKAGLDVRVFRPKALRRRLSACLRALRVSSAEEAIAVLERRPELAGQVLEVVLIGASGFFRDESVFAQLRRSVLPELLKSRRGLRVYSAGCADGQELYSMAMLLEESGALDDSYLLGVDCRPEAIQRARAGLFPAKELVGMLPEFKERYFELKGAHACLSPDLRSKIAWQVTDLLTPAESGGGWDVILFRNLAMYLIPEETGIWERLTAELRPGGVMVTGKAERPPAGLPLIRVSPCIYLKTEQ